MAAPGYAVIGIFKSGNDKPSLMSYEGRVIVFDHPQQARDYLPLLGNGRITQWADCDTVSWMPLDPDGVNRAVIITEYDVYNLPPGHIVRSEVKSMAWVRHMPWAEWVSTPQEGVMPPEPEVWNGV